MPKVVRGREKESPVAVHDQGPWELLPAMQGQDLYRLWQNFPRGASRLRRKMPSGGLPYAGQ